MAIDESRISRAFCFVLDDGTVVYPVQIERQGSGVIAFRVSMRGNTLEDCEQVEEATMIRKVLDEGFGVRCTSLDGTVHGIYKPDGKSVREIRRGPST